MRFAKSRSGFIRRLKARVCTSNTDQGHTVEVRVPAVLAPEDYVVCVSEQNLKGVEVNDQVVMARGAESFINRRREIHRIDAQAFGFPRDEETRQLLLWPYAWFARRAPDRLGAGPSPGRVCASEFRS